MVVAHDLSEYRYMDDVTRNLFSLFCSTWRAVLKMFVRFSFGLKQVKSLKKVQHEVITIERKMEKRVQKKILSTLECLNYKKSSQQLPSCFIAMRYSPFCKMFSPSFCFEQEKSLKNFSKKLYTIKLKKKKKKQRRKLALGT